MMLQHFTGQLPSTPRGGIQRALKVSIEGRLLGFLNELANESAALSGFLKEHR